MTDPAVPHIPYPTLPAMDDAERIAAAQSFYEHIRTRRTCRAFTDAPVPRAVIEAAIRAAGTAPNGANHQPWHFAAIASPDIRRGRSGSMRSPPSAPMPTSRFWSMHHG